MIRLEKKECQQKVDTDYSQSPGILGVGMGTDVRVGTACMVSKR